MGGGSDRGHGFVLDVATYLAGALDVGEPCHEVQGHVDAGADTSAGDEVAVVDEAGCDVGDDRGVELGQQVQGRPVGGGPTARQQSGRCVDEAPGADRGHEGYGVPEVADPCEVVGVSEHRPRAGPARVDEYVEWWSVVERVVRPKHEGLRTDDGSPVG